MSSVFGPMVGGDQVEEAVKDTLQYWMERYVREGEDQRGILSGSIPIPLSYQVTTEVENIPATQIPAVIIVSPGLDGEPVKRGDGMVSAAWMVGVAVVVSAKDRASTNKLAKFYGAVVRAILLQKASLRGFGSGVDWLDESYDPVPDEKGRTLSAAELVFRVHVDDVLNVLGGPGMSVPDEEIEPDEGDPADPDALPGSEREQFEDASSEIKPKEVS